MEEFLFVPVVLFLTIVAPIWIVMHYKSSRERQSGLSEAEYQRMQELVEISERMMERVETLESLLDKQAPGWRESGDAS
jgi:phage shock protein B